MPPTIHAPTASEAARASHNSDSQARPAEELLFPEARQRARRRRLGLAAAVVAAGGLVGGLLGSGAFGAAAPPPLPTAAGAFSRVVIASTERAGTAMMSFRYRDQITGGCIPDTNSPVFTGRGPIDFVDHDASFVEATTGCKDITPQSQTRWRSINGVQYLTFDRKIPGAPTSAARPWARLPVAGARAGTGGGGLSGVMTSNEPLRVLRALRGDVHWLGPRSLDGVPTVAYLGHATLASVDAVTGGGSALVVPGSPAGSHLEPAARTIPIRFEIWVDGLDRVRKVAASEPLYTGVYKGGSDTEDAAQVASVALAGEAISLARPAERPTRLSRRSPVQQAAGAARVAQAALAAEATLQRARRHLVDLPLVRLRRQSELEVQLRFTAFGSPVRLVAPPAKRTVHLPAG